MVPKAGVKKVKNTNDGPIDGLWLYENNSKRQVPSRLQHILTFGILGCLLTYDVSDVHHAGRTAEKACNQPVPDVSFFSLLGCAMFRKSDRIVSNSLSTDIWCPAPVTIKGSWPRHGVPTIFIRLFMYTLPLFIVYLIVSKDMIMGRDGRVIWFILAEVTRLKGWEYLFLILGLVGLPVGANDGELAEEIGLIWENTKHRAV